MTQKKKKTAPKSTAIQVVKPNPVPAVIDKPTPRVNYPILSFILSVAVLVIWFLVGRLFMEMAVNENLCHIRTKVLPKQTGEVVAIVDGENIYMSEIRDYAKTIPQLSELPFEVVYPQLLETVVNSRVLRAAADRAGTANLPSVQQAVQLAYDQIIAQTYLDQRLKKLVTDERLKALYQEELQHFKPVDEVRARHILVKTEQAAQDVIIQLKAGASFEMLAGKYSEDNASPDGDLGYFTEDMMIPEFGKAAFALRKGQISAPIKTPFGWHVVQIVDRRQTEPPAFEDVKNDLKQMLMEKDMATILKEEREKQNVRIRKPKI